MSLLRLLASKNDELSSQLQQALQAWNLGDYWQPIVRSDSYRRQFRKHLRVALLLKAALSTPGRVSPLGYLVTGKLSLLGAVQVLPASELNPLPQPYRGPPYLFLSSTERADSRLLLLLQQERPPEELLRQALMASLSAPARELLSSGALKDFASLSPDQIKSAFDEPITRRRRLYAAFELLGSRPTLVDTDQYDLPSLVEHYCALFGHTEEQLQYLQSVGKKVYLAQQRHLPQRVKGLAYFYRPVVTDAELRADQQGWLQRLKMYPEMRADSLSEWPHYMLQAWLDANAARVQFMLEELLLESGAIAQELLLEVAYRLAYEPSFLRWLSEVYSDTEPVVAAVLRQPQWPWVALIDGGYLQSVELLLRHMNRARVPVELLLDTAIQTGQDDILELLLGWLPADRVLAYGQSLGEAAPAMLKLRLVQLEQGRMVSQAIQQRESRSTLAGI